MQGHVPIADWSVAHFVAQLVLGLGLDSELHYFSIFTENKKKMSTLSSANVTDVNLVLKNAPTCVYASIC